MSDSLTAALNGGPVVIFAAARMGRAFLASLRGAGIDVVAFGDNAREKWGSEIDGVVVLDPDTLLARFRRTPVLIASLLAENEVYHQLTRSGFSAVYPLSVLHRERPDLFVAPYLNGTWESADSVEAKEGAHLWADEASRAVYNGILDYRRTQSMTAYPGIRARHAQYFPPGIVTLTADGAVVDGGGFDGDTFRSFVAHHPRARNPYYAFEPDPANYARLAASGDAYQGQFIPVNAGLGAEEATLPFSDNGRMDSTFIDASAATATLTLPVHTIDRFVPREAPTTFIRMDIEGMEPEALRGAEETIRADAPTLAICVYHRPEHLWEIPSMVREWRPDYRLYLRHYSTNMSETVMYAVSPRQDRV